MESNSGYSSPRNYSWAAFLILVGIMFLLNTTGVVSWTIWMYVLRFWPILIVLIGVRIILGSSLFARIVGMLLTIVLTVGAFGVAYIQAGGEALSFLPKKVNDWVLEGGSGVLNLKGDVVEESEEYSFNEYEDIKERSFKMDVGACKFTIGDEDIVEHLKIDSSYPKAYEAPELESSFEEGILDLEFVGASTKSVYLFYDESKYDITFGNIGIPTDLDIKLGAGEGAVILEELKIKDVWAEVGAGKLSMDFGTDSLPSGELRFSVGAGQITLRIPQRVGYELTYDLGVGEIKTDGRDISGISGGRGKFTSTNFNTSDIRLNIFVSVGVGSFNIESN